MRVLGILCLLLAIGVGLASQFAPHHEITQAIVEGTARIPGDLHPALILAILSALLLWMSPTRRWRPAPGSSTHPPRPQSTDSRAKTLDPPPKAAATRTDTLEDWKTKVLEAMDELKLENGASLHIDRKQGVPFTLILERCTPGRSRRSIDQLGLFLKSLPTPPRVAILFRDCERANVAWQHLVSGALLPHIGRDSAQTVAQPDRVDLIFHDPDPCYASDSSE